MFTDVIIKKKAEYFDVFHSNKPQHIKDTMLRSIHEEIGRLETHNKQLWVDSKAKSGDVNSVIEYWKRINK